MISQLYIDNFRTLQNFEIGLNETNILLGPNGSGKSSVFDVLRKVQQLVIGGEKVEQVFVTDDLSRSSKSSRQTIEFELEVVDDSGYNEFKYRLVIEYQLDRSRMRILEEKLVGNRVPLFEFNEGNAQLYRDDGSTGPNYPFDWSQSGLGVLQDRADNKKLSLFKKTLSRWVIVRPCPPLFGSESKTEDEFLKPMMENFVAWYRHASQENMGGVIRLFEELKEALPGFDALNLAESGENARTLKAAFKKDDGVGRVSRYSFSQLSDGQRQIIALYALLHLSGDEGYSLFIDEPDNYLSLREVQPWAASVVDSCGKSERLSQAVMISHHPITIDFLAAAKGRWFSRDPEGPTRVTSEAPKATEDLKQSDILARGWES